MAKVLCLWYATEQEIGIVKAALPAGTEVVAPKAKYFSRFDCKFEDAAPLAADCDAVLAFSVPDGILGKCDQLKVFSWMHSGVDDLRQIGAIDFFRKNGVRLGNVRGGNAIAVSEQAMMFVLALAKQTVAKHRAFEEGKTLYPMFSSETQSAMLHNRTIGIIGVGQIGSNIARQAKGFGMRVLGVRKSAGGSHPDNFDVVHNIRELHDVLPLCDYVVLAVPDTPETEGMFGAEELLRMKKTAFLVNIARGNLIQEEALYDALTTGALRGYAADVWWHYAYGKSFPALWGSRLNIQKLPNVTVSFHEAHNADDVLERDIQYGAENLAEYFSGLPMKREVNLDEGY